MNQKELLIISVTVFLTVVGWILADLNHVATTKRVSEANPKFALPIESSVQKEIFIILQNKQK